MVVHLLKVILILEVIFFWWKYDDIPIAKKDYSVFVIEYFLIYNNDWKRRFVLMMYNIERIACWN